MARAGGREQDRTDCCKNRPAPVDRGSGCTAVCQAPLHSARYMYSRPLTRPVRAWNRKQGVAASIRLTRLHGRGRGWPGRGLVSSSRARERQADCIAVSAAAAAAVAGAGDHLGHNAPLTPVPTPQGTQSSPVQAAGEAANDADTNHQGGVVAVNGDLRRVAGGQPAGMLSGHQLRHPQPRPGAGRSGWPALPAAARLLRPPTCRDTWQRSTAQRTHLVVASQVQHALQHGIHVDALLCLQGSRAARKARISRGQVRGRQAGS